MYLTPSGFKFLVLQEIISSDGKPKTVIMNSREFAFVRPKRFTPSTPATWASEYLVIAQHAPELFDLQPTSLSQI
jgi:hypothetical protein